MTRVICLQTPTVFWLSGGSISPSYRMYMGLVMLGTLKYTQQNRQRLIQVPLRLSWLIEKIKSQKSIVIDQSQSSLTFRHRASSIQDRHFATLQRTLFIYLINKYISLSDICLTVLHPRCCRTPAGKIVGALYHKL